MVQLSVMLAISSIDLFTVMLAQYPISLAFAMLPMF